MEQYINKIIQGDCLEKLKDLPENSVDSIVTDPPYELGFMGKSWDNTGIANNKEMWAECLRVLKPGGHLLAFSGTRTYHRMAVAIEDAGFEVRDMIEWVYSTGFPKSLNVFKALKKKCECGNMEVYEKRIQLQQPVGETEAEYFMRFMQDRDLSQTKPIKEKQGEVLQSGLSEQSTHGTMQGEEPKEGSLWGEERILEGWNNIQKTEGELQGSDLSEMSEGVFADGEKRRIHNATQIGDGSKLGQTSNENGSSTSRRPQSEQQQYREPCAFCKQWGTQAIRTLGVGTSLKPSHEPICMARKPLSEKTVALNVLKWGTGGIDIDGSRVGTEDTRQKTGGAIEGSGWGTKGGAIAGSELGRFPANLIHDNSEEVRECFPESKGGAYPKLTKDFTGKSNITFRGSEEREERIELDNQGNASRFFKSIEQVNGDYRSLVYIPKASKSERNAGLDVVEEENKRPQGEAFGDGSAITEHSERKGNFHPTVKPIALMEYLIKMVTPKGGTVLDPFAGSGSTLVAAKQNGYQYVGIEMTAEYIPIIEARLNVELNTLF